MLLKIALTLVQERRVERMYGSGERERERECVCVGLFSHSVVGAITPQWQLLPLGLWFRHSFPRKRVSTCNFRKPI